MRGGIRLVFVLLACVVSVASALEAKSMTVPRGTAPVLDGTLSEGEWGDALRIPLNDQAHFLLKHADGFLFLGIQATTMGTGSLLLVVGEEVHVLHASAALGTAIYAREGEVWDLRQDFVWQCRTLGFSNYAQNERARFLGQNGWLGTIGYLGAPTQSEYQIAWGDEPLILLFLFLEGTDPLQLLSWPLTPEAASPYLTLITGPMPTEIRCSLSDWATLERGD